MKVLIVARRKKGRFAPFVEEQVEALRKAGVDCRYFGMDDNNYRRHVPDFKKALAEFNPDLVHAHYGLCGCFANIQRKYPVVTTFHGSDINIPYIRVLSKVAMQRSAFSIFVSKKHIDLMHPRKNYALIPCGINLEDFPPVDRQEARKESGLDPDKKYILFSGAFDNPVKNASLARTAVEEIDRAVLIELKGYSRKQVALLMNAADALLMTSLSEGSPQVIKEAMACGCPIVSVDVGDVKEQIDAVEGCHIAGRSPEDLRDKLLAALSFDRKTNGREILLKRGMTTLAVTGKLISRYTEILGQS